MSRIVLISEILEVLIHFFAILNYLIYSRNLLTYFPVYVKGRVYNHHNHS